MITGRRPFSGDSMVTTALAHVSQPAPQLSDEVREPLRTTVMAALAKDPRQRPSSAAAFVAALRAATRGAAGRAGRRRRRGRHAGDRGRPARPRPDVPVRPRCSADAGAAHDPVARDAVIRDARRPGWPSLPAQRRGLLAVTRDLARRSRQRRDPAVTAACHRHRRPPDDETSTALTTSRRPHHGQCTTTASRESLPPRPGRATARARGERCSDGTTRCSADATRSGSSSAGAAWPRSTSATTRASAGPWPSRCCAPTWPGTPSSSPGSGARPSRPPGSTTRRSSRSTTPARTTTTEAGGASVPVPYIVMEYVEGRTLRELLNAQLAARPGRGRAHHRGRPRRAGLQPPHGHRPPRHQAGQRHDRAAGRDQGDGLRHRPGASPTPTRR